MSMPELRPMGVGDILDATFRLYRQRFVAFLLIALVVYVPYGLLASVLQPFPTAPQPVAAQRGAAHDARAPHAEFAQVSAVTFVPWIIMVFLFAVILLPLCSAALVQNISASYLGEDLSAGQSYARAAPRLFGLVGTQMLAGLAMMVGFVLCVVPGIYLSLWFLVVVPVVILEGRYGTTALRRSYELMKGNINKGFLLGLVLLILGFLVNIVLQRVAPLLPHPVLGIFLTIICQALILPIQTAPWTLLYYDLRIRKEAFDLQMLSAALSEPAAGGPGLT
jgi:hypothetical protein